MIGLPRWPWNPETVGHRACKRNRALQAKSMALRDIHRLGPLPRAQNRSNRLPVVHQGRPRPWPLPWLPGNPDKHRLGTTYRRAVKDYSQVAGNPKPARVRVPMTVIKNQVRRVPQLRKRPQQHRNLAKAKQARHVRKCEGTPRPDPFQLGHLREPVHNDARDCHATPEIERHVRARHLLDLGKPVERFETASQPQLNPRSLARSYAPTMQSQRFHPGTLIGRHNSVKLRTGQSIAKSGQLASAIGPRRLKGPFAAPSVQAHLWRPRPSFWGYNSRAGQLHRAAVQGRAGRGFLPFIHVSGKRNGRANLFAKGW